MPVELEAKVKIDSHEPVRAMLSRLGAQRVSRVMETNTFFDTPTRTLLSQDRGLRLRIKQDLDRNTTKAVVTFKGPRQPGAFKQREELEYEVSDAPAAAACFNALGFATELSFQKRRESWRVNACLVELDEMPILGTFVEIEGPTADEVESVRRALKLDAHELINDSYIAMLVAELDRRGVKDRVITF